MCAANAGWPTSNRINFDDINIYIFMIIIVIERLSLAAQNSQNRQAALFQIFTKTSKNPMGNGNEILYDLYNLIGSDGFDQRQNLAN